MKYQKKDLLGKNFGRLHVISSAGYKGPRALWLCLCVCGNETTATTTALTTGTKKSCGCLAKDVLRKRNITHGLTGTSIYKRWEQMISRCYNKKDKSYKNYGGRGLQVCNRWRNSLQNFSDDMGPIPDNSSIDRKDNDKGYSPDNCRWASQSTQARNRRGSKTWHIKGIDFETCTDAANHFNVTHQAIIQWCSSRKDCSSKLRYEY